MKSMHLLLFIGCTHSICFTKELVTYTSKLDRCVILVCLLLLWQATMPKRFSVRTMKGKQPKNENNYLIKERKTRMKYNDLIHSVGSADWVVEKEEKNSDFKWSREKTQNDKDRITDGEMRNSGAKAEKITPWTPFYLSNGFRRKLSMEAMEEIQSAYTGTKLVWPCSL